MSYMSARVILYENKQRSTRTFLTSTTYEVCVNIDPNYGGPNVENGGLDDTLQLSNLIANGGFDNTLTVDNIVQESQ